MPPPDGGGIPPLGDDGPDISDLQPLITSIATAASKMGLIQAISGDGFWLYIIVLPSQWEVWRRTQSRRNYWV
jgi:hypothetical protein